MPAEADHELLACKRCNQQYTIECGYEPSKHGFCWPCCDEIIARLMEIAADTDQCVDLYFFPKREGPRSVGEHARYMFREFLKRGTAKPE